MMVPVTHLKIPPIHVVIDRKPLPTRGSVPSRSSINHSDCRQYFGTEATQYVLLNIQQYIVADGYRELTSCR
jgi:hypothetical protein